MSRRRWFTCVLLVPVLVGCAVAGLTTFSSPVGASSTHEHHADHKIDPRDQAAAMLATAGNQDVATAEAAGYASTLNTLGCFQNATEGGMGVHYVNAALMDGTVDITKPEAMVYELGLDGKPIALVAHEYIVPVDAWTSKKPPRLFGVDFHRHPTLPLWVLHAWLWKDNPSGMFADWNPAVRQCPAGVPIFGIDLRETRGRIVPGAPRAGHERAQRLVFFDGQ